MRRWIAGAALVGFACAVLLDAAQAPANTNPPSAQDRKVEAAARKSVARIGRGAAAAVRSAASQAAKTVNGVAKALKSGRNVAQVTGVPSTPGVKVTDEQRLAGFEIVFETVGQFHGQALVTIQDAYDQSLRDSALFAYGESTIPTRLPGTGGPADVFATTLHHAWQDGADLVQRAVVKVQAGAAQSGGANFTYVPFPVPPLTIPAFDAGSVAALPTSQILATGATSDGTIRTLTAAPPTKQVAGQDTRVAGVSFAAGGATAPMPEIATFNDLVFYHTLDASVVEPGAYAYGRNAAGTPVTPCTQVSIPDPCVPPARRELRDTVLLFQQSDGTGPRALAQYFELVPLFVGGSAYNSNRNIQINATTPNVDQQYRASGNIGRVANKLALLDAGAFPCGMGPNGLTVCAEIQAPDPGGRELVVAVTYGADIALAHPSDSYQFGFVFDGDGNAANNYVASAQFAGDYYQGTDTWYSLEYAPGTGWKLKVTDARNGGFVAKASAARVLISGRTIALAVPASEFAVARPAFRTTSFRHSGDFGQNPPFDYNADYDPEPGKALAPFPDK